jgi:hypothetical protein
MKNANALYRHHTINESVKRIVVRERCFIVHMNSEATLFFSFFFIFVLYFY